MISPQHFTSRVSRINQAVTRGLDPNVRLNPSGVEWLGDVPEHWDVFATWTRHRPCNRFLFQERRVQFRCRRHTTSSGNKCFSWAAEVDGCCMVAKDGL